MLFSFAFRLLQTFFTHLNKYLFHSGSLEINKYSLINLFKFQQVLFIHPLQKLTSITYSVFFKILYYILYLQTRFKILKALSRLIIN